MTSFQVFAMALGIAVMAMLALGLVVVLIVNAYSFWFERRHRG